MHERNKWPKIEGIVAILQRQQKYLQEIYDQDQENERSGVIGYTSGLTVFM